MISDTMKQVFGVMQQRLIAGSGGSIIQALLWLLLSVTGFAQQQNNTVSIPMKSGLVFYEQVYASNGNRKEELIRKTVRWFHRSFSHMNTKISGDRDAGKISGTILFKIVTNAKEGHHYWIKADLALCTTANGYLIQVFNFYEKPVMPGVTNDYSKIEYRWWDFRKGKPWHPEDVVLFDGLDRQTLILIDSLQKELSN